MKPFDLTTYLVLDPVLCQPIGMAETARLAAEAGATMVQLRHKTADTELMIKLGREITAAIAHTPALLIVNDDVEAAVALQADGLHIGQEDAHAADARARIGQETILGLSVETVAAADALDPAVVDYAGVGPVFSTPTKTDHKTPIGINGLQDLVARLAVPAVAIGGLKAEHAANVMATGVSGMAVVSAICGQDDPAQATRNLHAAILGAKR